MNNFGETLVGLLGFLYALATLYFGFIWSVEWVETKGFVSYLFFGEIIVSFKAVLWPLFLLIG